MPGIILEFVDNSSNTLDLYINRCVDYMKDVLFREETCVDKLVYVIEQYNNENPLHIKLYNGLPISRQILLGHNKNKALVLRGYINSNIVCCVYLDFNGFI